MNKKNIIPFADIYKFLDMYKWFETMTWYKKCILFITGMFNAFIIHMFLILIGVL